MRTRIRLQLLGAVVGVPLSVSLAVAGWEWRHTAVWGLTLLVVGGFINDDRRLRNRWMVLRAKIAEKVKSD